MRELVRNQHYSRTAVQAVFHFIDYLLQLPEKYTSKLSEDIRPILRKEKKLMELYNKENASPTIQSSFALELEKGKEAARLAGVLEGEREGKLEEKRSIARKLMIEYLPLEKIAHITGLSLEEVQHIQETIN